MPTAVQDIDVIIPLAKGLSTRPHSEVVLVKHGITAIKLYEYVKTYSPVNRVEHWA